MSEVSDKFLVDEIQNLRRENSSLKRQIDFNRDRFQKLNMSLRAGIIDTDLEHKKAFITLKLKDLELFSCYYNIEIENNYPVFKSELYNDFHDVLDFLSSINADWSYYLSEKLFQPFHNLDTKERE